MTHSPHLFFKEAYKRSWSNNRLWCTVSAQNHLGSKAIYLTNEMEYFRKPVKQYALLSCQCYIKTSGKTRHVHMRTHAGYISIYILVKPRPLDIMYTHIQPVETPFTQKHHHSNPHSLSLSLSMREKALKTKVSILFALGMTHGYKSRCTLWSCHDTWYICGQVSIQNQSRYTFCTCHGIV